MPGGQDRLDQLGEDVQHLAAHPGNPPVRRFFQPPRLAQQVRPTPQAVQPGAVNAITVRHEHPGKVLAQRIAQHLAGSSSNEVEYGRGGNP